MTPKVSVIIPVYNGEKYLEKCIQSVLNQTYINLEVIIIDDGSRDSSLVILEKLVKKDNRVIVLKQQNSGVAVARNRGLDVCSGDFVVFIDSDDFVDLKFIEQLVSTMITNDCDLILSGYCRIYIRDTIQKKEYYSFPDRKMTRNDFLEDIFCYLDRMLIQGPCFKLFKTEIIKKNNIKFEETIQFGEDTVFIYNYLKHIEEIYNLDVTLYNYINYSNNSLSTKPLGQKTDIFLYLYSILKKMFIENNLFNSEIKTQLNKRYCNLLIYLQYDIYHLDKKERYRQIGKLINNPILVDAFKSVNCSNIQFRIIKFLMLKKYIKLIDWYFQIKQLFKSIQRQWCFNK
ncbi:Chondroitin polymerase [Turicibacter sanguinis]|nr:Chondroitin polymerase [Turicibacter sanguinis]